MAKKKIEGEEVISVEEEKKEPELASDFEYKSIGNFPYDFDKDSLVFTLKAQVPFRMNHDDMRVISTGIKVRIPDGCIGLITNCDIDPKSQVQILGAPVIVLPSIEEKEIMLTLKMFGYGFKIYKMGDDVAKLVIIKSKAIKSVKK